MPLRSCPLPPELDDEWNRVVAALRTFDHRRDGALLLRTQVSGTLTWKGLSGRESRWIGKGESVTLFSPGGAPFVLTWQPAGTVAQRYETTVGIGQTAFAELAGGDIE
jgi:hypothetical protein